MYLYVFIIPQSIIIYISYHIYIYIRILYIIYMCVFFQPVPKTLINLHSNEDQLFWGAQVRHETFSFFVLKTHVLDSSTTEKHNPFPRAVSISLTRPCLANAGASPGARGGHSWPDKNQIQVRQSHPKARTSRTFCRKSKKIIENPCLSMIGC